MREDIAMLELMLTLIDEDAMELIDEAKALTGQDVNRLTAIKRRLEELKTVGEITAKQLSVLKAKSLSIH